MSSMQLLLGFIAGATIVIGLPGAPASAVAVESANPSGEEFHKPRHGGYFGDADDVYHYEVLVLGDEMRLYVNDDFNRPLNALGLNGKWKLSPDSSSPISGDFSPAPDGAYLAAVLPKISADSIHVEVSVQKGKLWAPLEFYIPLNSN